MVAVNIMLRRRPFKRMRDSEIYACLFKFSPELYGCKERAKVVIKDMHIYSLLNFFFEEVGESFACIIIFKNIKFNTDNIPGICYRIKNTLKDFFSALQQPDVIVFSKWYP